MATSTRRALFWSFVERYFGLMISIASTMLLARLLTPEEVGIYSMCAAFTAVAGILRDFGVSEYLIQEKTLTHDKLRSAYTVAFFVAWSIAAVAFLGRGPLASFYQEPRIEQVMLVLCLHFLILPVASPTYALLNREMAFKKIFLLGLTSSLTQAVVSVVLAARGHGVLALAWGPIANIVAQILLSFYLRPRDMLHLPGVKEIRSVLRFGTMYVASRALDTLTRNVHEPVIGKVFGFAAVGMFSRANGLIEMFNANVTAAVVRVMTPTFAEHARRDGSIEPIYARSTSLFTSVSLPFFGSIALLAEPIIDLMFGRQWLPAAPLASALAIAAMPAAFFAMIPQMLSATGHVGKRLRVSLLYCPVHVISILLATRVSLQAVANVWIAGQLVLMVLYLQQARRALGLGFMALLRPGQGALVLTAATLGAEGLALAAVRQLAWPTIVQLAGVAAIGCVAWLVAARWTRHPIYDELLSHAQPLSMRFWRLFGRFHGRDNQ